MTGCSSLLTLTVAGALAMHLAAVSGHAVSIGSPRQQDQAAIQSELISHFKAVVHDPTPLATDSEREALVALYKSTNGPQWVDNSNWLTGDPCVNNWQGIVCDSGRVLHLNLETNNLDGTLPPNFGALKGVTWISLDSNNLRGPIPESIGNMTQVQLFTIAAVGGAGGDGLSGIIPDSICNLKGMFSFDGRGNKFTGAPACMCQNQYTNCDLSYNPLVCSQTAPCLKSFCKAACT